MSSMRAHTTGMPTPKPTPKPMGRLFLDLEGEEVAAGGGGDRAAAVAATPTLVTETGVPSAVVSSAAKLVPFSVAVDRAAWMEAAVDALAVATVKVTL